MRHLSAAEAEYRELLAASGETPTAPANIGRQAPMLTTALAGGLVALNDTQLISMRVNSPQQWVITVGQSFKPNEPTPWRSNFDGAAYDANAQFGAPATPQQAGVSLSMLQMRVRWGAGGTRFQTAFDYPMAGVAFGLAADTVDVDVTLRSSAAQQGIPPAQVPVVGAFMVPGQAQDPLPLRWAEAPVNVNAAAGASWSVKPYSKRLHVVVPGSNKVTGAWFIVSGAAPNTATVQSFTLVEQVAGAGIDALVNVPAQAELVGLTNNGGVGTNFFLEWQMGLV